MGLGLSHHVHVEGATPDRLNDAPRMVPSPYPHVIAKVPAQLPPPSRRRQYHRGMLHMVSADHFAQELRTQMSRAAKHGSMDIVINSGELYRSVGGYPGSMHGMPACCDAMRSEVMPCAAK